jgi:uncharacterized protein with LGFP repeats
VLGLPSAEQQQARLAGAWLQEFRSAGARRVVYWGPTTGSHEVYDQLLTKYVAIGAETSALGLPTSGPKAINVVYGRLGLFEHGRMYYAPATGTHPIVGPINDRYVQPDAAPRLGLPTTDEYAVDAGRAQDFEHGRITWDATTGEATVTLT